MAISAYLSDILTRYFFLGETLTPPIDINTFNYWERYPWLSIITERNQQWGPDDWTEISPGVTTGYHRTALALSWITDGNHYLYNNYLHYCPVASIDWSPVKGVVIWDAAGYIPYQTGWYDFGYGHVLFDLPWTTNGNTIIPSLTITAGKRITFDAWDILLAFRGKEPRSLTNGGMSLQYTEKVLKWVAGLLTTVPIAERTYDIAIGRGVDPDDFGKFTGVWTECSGSDYNRITMSTSDWEESPSYGVTNAHEITFTNSAESAWGYIEDVILYATGTDVPAFWGHLYTPVTINLGDGFSIGSNQLVIAWEGKAISS